MTYLPGNRGVQPPYSPSASLPRHRVGQQRSSQSQGQNAQPVRFGGDPVQNAMNNGWQRFVNLTLPSFENITEVFIWGFLAQDVIAMWLPRIYALLTEGRKAYDPKDDPSAKNKPFGTQFKKYVKGNLEGLNWDNFYEGTKREFATGPGLLMVPAALYMVASKFANPAIKMPFGAVKGLSKGLKDQFDQAPQGKDAREQAKAYVKNIFQDPLFTDAKLTELKGLEAEASKDTKHLITDLQGWANKWVDNFSNTDANAKKDEAKKLSQQLKETVRAFNRQYRMAAYKASENKKGVDIEVKRLIKDEHPLHRTESTWISYQPEKLKEMLTTETDKHGNPMTAEQQVAKAGKRLRQMPVTEVLRDLTRMEGLVKGIEDKAANTETLGQAAQQTMERMVKMKFAMSLGATAITAAYLTKLAFWAQNHNTYQATRLLNEKTAQNHGNQSSQSANVRSRRADQQQSIAPVAGSAHVLQPAFSMVSPVQNQPFARPAQMPAVSPFVQAKPAVAVDPNAQQVDERRQA